MLKSILRAFLWLAVVTMVMLVALLYFLPGLLPQEKLRAALTDGYAQLTHKTMTISGNVEMGFLPQAFFAVKGATFSDPAQPDAPVHQVAALRMEFDLVQALMNRAVITFSGEADGQRISGTVDLPTVSRYNRGGVNAISLRITQPFILNITGKLLSEKGHLALTEINVALAQTKGTGTLDASSEADLYHYSGQWQFSVLDLDEVAAAHQAISEAAELFLPAPAPVPEPEKKEEKPAEPASPVPQSPPGFWPDTPLNVDWIPFAKAELSLTADKVLYRGYTHENIAAKLEAKNGQLSIAINNAKLFGGEGTATLLVDVTTGEPYLHHTLTLHNADIGRLLRDVYQLNGIEGTGDMTVDALASGYTLKEVVSTLNGKGSITLKDGLLKGVDILGMANPAPANIRKAFYNGDNDTKVIDASATFSMTEGMLMNNDLVVNVPFLRLTGRGTLDFLEMSIKYRITPIVGVERIGLAVPLLLSGPLQHPDVRPDVGGILTQGMDDIVLSSRPVKAVTDTVSEGLKAVPGVKQLMDALPGTPQRTVGEAAPKPTEVAPPHNP